MDFALSEEQQLLQTTVNELLQSKCPLERIRADVENEVTKDTAIANELKSLGIPGILVPEDYGGVGLGLLEAALVSECLGSVIAPVPFIGTAVMTVIALTQSSNEELRQEWLPQIASGDLTVGIALSDHTGRRGDSQGIRLLDGALVGQTMFALDANDASAFLIADRSGGLHLVQASDVDITQLFSVDRTRSIGELQLSNVSGATLTVSGMSQHDLLSKVIDAGRVMLAADTLGAAQTMLNKAVEYAGERKQFNRIIGSFQAVKHMCAEMAAELEPCRSLVWYAAHAFKHIPEDARLTACHAKAHLAEVGKFVARKATEVHGGMGFTDLLGLHYWFKRVGLNRQLLGTPDFIRNEAAMLQGWVQP